jgi:hypothetical protein
VAFFAETAEAARHRRAEPRPSVFYGRGGEHRPLFIVAAGREPRYGPLPHRPGVGHSRFPGWRDECINKADLDPGDQLFEIYEKSGLGVLRASAATGSGIDALRRELRGRKSAFTGNSGAGKSSILNALDPSLCLPVGEVSRKLGRGRHTTRHVELHALGYNTFVADTPAFASIELRSEPIRKNELPYPLPDFAPFW